MKHFLKFKLVSTNKEYIEMFSCEQSRLFYLTMMSPYIIVLNEWNES